MSFDSDRLSEICDNYLTWSIAYYDEDRALASDNMYDTGCLILRNNYASLPKWFTESVSYDDLKAGTGYKLDLGLFPLEVRVRVDLRLLCDREWEF